MQSMRAVLYLAVFLDLFGFGMLIPDIQLRAEAMGAHGWLIGLILASTFIIQVPASPLWGRISDRIGRKPVFVVCTAFSAGGMLVYGFAGQIPLLIVSRALSGLGGANVAMGQAILASSSTEGERLKAMGRISAAVSLGLVAGPVFGGLISGAYGSHVLGWTAGGFSALGALLVWAFIPNFHTEPETPREKASLGLLRKLPQVRDLVVIAAVAWFSLATLEGTFGRLIEHTMEFGQAQFGIVFGFESLLGFAIQGWLLGPISGRISNVPILRIGYFLQGLGLALTPFAYLFPFHTAWLGVLLVCSAIYTLGSAVANPTVNALCSKLTPQDRQGELFGVLQGARSVGFIFGPILGGVLFDRWFASPYLLAGATCVLAALLVGRIKATSAIPPATGNKC